MRVLLVMGTRPEAIKLAPVVLEMRRRPALQAQVCLSAQHRELLDEPLRLFGIQAGHDLDLMEPDQDPLGLCARALPALGQVLARARPDLVLVQGDTTTALCGALAAFHHRIRVGHVEAGLRTGRRDEPFPEEMNRRLLAPLADLCFAPTEAARRALLREGVDEAAIFVTGNTVVDALLEVAALPPPADLPPLEPARRLMLVTCHRREHHGPILRGILGAVRDLLEEFPDVEAVLPVHPNPNVVAAVREVLAGVPRLHAVPPLPYRSFVALLERATLVLTDSGGVQEEAPVFGTPVLVLRRATERTEGLAAGNAALVGTDPQAIRRAASILLRDESARRKMAQRSRPYGDGQAARRICDVLERLEGVA